MAKRTKVEEPAGHEDGDTVPVVPILSRLRPPAGAVRSKRRKGRGVGSGLGKTAGKGMKGQKARHPGGFSKLAFEGGQTPLQRRLPKQGFHNPFRKTIVTVNVAERKAGENYTIQVQMPAGYAPPSTGRTILNLSTMRPSLVYVDSATGDLLEEHVLPAAIHQLSIRHLTVAADDQVVFGCQHQGPLSERPPLIGFHRRGEPVQMLEAPDATQLALENYIGSVAADPSRRLVAASSPRGGLVQAARRPEGWRAPGPPPPAPPEDPALWPGPDEDLCYLAGDWRILQRQDGHRWSLDDLATAWFAASSVATPPSAILDLGCGIGTVLLFLAWRFPDARAIGVEAQELSAGLARRSLVWNGVSDRVEVRLGDLREPGAVPDGPFELFGLRVTPIPLIHGRIMSCGWRVNDVAYLTDTNGIPAESSRLLRGLELMIVDGLRPRPHPTHFSIGEALEASAELRPRRALLTHLNHEVDHARISAELPPGVGLAFDGLTIDLA